MTDHVHIFDTTLRDGEQSPGISLDADQKVTVAAQLARLGVDVIEAGFPVASPGDFAAVQRIAREVDGPVIAALARTHRGDIERAWQSVRDAARPRLHVFLATSPIHMEHKLRMTPEQVMEGVRTGVAAARERCDDVEYSPEDATRSDHDFLVAVCRTAVEAGATTINIPDTVGYATPGDFGALIRRIVDEVKGDRRDVRISAHCHNDLGLAVANSLAAVRNGARQVETAVNGIGERAGNAATEEVVMALTVRGDVYDVVTTVDTSEIYDTSKLVADVTGYPIQYNKAVVGRNAFAHESGIHQHGVLREPSTYEIMDPAAVGQGGTEVVLGKHSGRAAFRHALERLDITLTDEAFGRAFDRFKELTDRKVEVTDRELRAIVDEHTSIDDMVRLVSLQVAGGTQVRPQAKVTVETRDLRLEYQAEGDGMVDATFQAVRSAFGTEARLLGYDVRPLSGGSDALAEIEVSVQVDGRVHQGVGISTDVVEGSARAVVAALNRAAGARMADLVGAGREVSS